MECPKTAIGLRKLAQSTPKLHRYLQKTGRRKGSPETIGENCLIGPQKNVSAHENAAQHPAKAPVSGLSGRQYPGRGFAKERVVGPAGLQKLKQIKWLEKGLGNLKRIRIQ